MGLGDKTRFTEADVEYFLLRLATDDSFRTQVERSLLHFNSVIRPNRSRGLRCAI